MSPQLDPQQLLNFYKLAEKLKLTMRHSWLSDGKRQESVAEHTWMMGMLSLIIIPHLARKLDQVKVLKMIIIHDLAEALTTDTPIWDGVQKKEEKHKLEKAAIEKIFGTIDEETSKELLEVWQEYEARETPEAYFVKVLDTLDVIVQHNVAPTDTWNDKDFFWQLSPIQDKFFDFDQLLRNVKNAIDDWSIEKATEANGKNKLDQEQLRKKWTQLKKQSNVL